LECKEALEIIEGAGVITEAMAKHRAVGKKANQAWAKRDQLIE